LNIGHISLENIAAVLKVCSNNSARFWTATAPAALKTQAGKKFYILPNRRLRLAYSSSAAKNCGLRKSGHDHTDLLLKNQMMRHIW
jgi:hypothetical protein